MRLLSKKVRRSLGEREYATPERVVHKLSEDIVHIVSLDIVRKSFEPVLGYIYFRESTQFKAF